MAEDLSRAGGYAVLARRYAGRVAVADRGGAIRYDALFARAAALGLALIEAGVRPGDPVAIHVRNGIAAVWASLGAALAGAAETALNASLSEADRRHCLALAGARHVVAAGADAALFEGPGLRVHALESVGEADLRPADFPRVAPGTPARIGFTSGTTGSPKGIVTDAAARAHGNLLQRATLPYRPGAGSRLLLMTPFSHGASLLTHATLDLGGAVTLLDGVDAPHVLDLLARREVDAMFAPPTVLAKITAAAEAEGRALPGLRAIFTGTAPLPPALYRRARALFGPVVRVTYGKSEVVNPITVLEADETDAWYAEGGEGEGAPGACVGWPATGVEVVVGDPERPAPTGEVGEVFIRAGQMLAGTIRVEATGRGGEDAPRYEPRPPGGFHASGDLGHLDARGRLHLVGRVADVIKTGGYKLAPEEVERALASALAGAEAAAFGVPSEYWGEVVALAVERPAPDWRERIAAAARDLTAYKRPRLLVAVEALPKNSMGKLSRRALREMVMADRVLVDGPRPELAPRGVDETR